jgi:type III secretion protein U
MSEKTEEPTEKRLRDARKKGQVAKSKEASATAELIALLVLVFAGFPAGTAICADLFARSFRAAADTQGGKLDPMLMATLRTLGCCTLPVLAVGLFAIIIANTAQIGLLFSFEALQPKFDKLNPFGNLKQMFSPDAMFEFLMSFVKLGVLSDIFYQVMKKSLNALLGTLEAGLPAIVPVSSIVIKQTVTWFSAVFALLAMADYLFRKKRFKKQNMMTKDEVKREWKDSEGDPHIKSKRKELAQELLEQATISKTREASVVIVNPTHFAVAIHYDENMDTLPLVVGKGEGRLALRMIKAADEAGVPIFQDVPLARGLFAESSVGQQIPVSFIKPVAETLKWVRRLKRK